MAIAALALNCSSGSFAEEIEFNRDIRPILSDKCFACHGPDAGSREADLRLDRESSAKADRGGYAAIAAGDSAESELITRVTSVSDDDRMPPAEHGKPLSPRQIDLLTRWIDQGAPWQLSWSYVPPAHRERPNPQNESWPRNWVDYFILAKIESEGLSPSPDADKTTLVRRIYIDLLGLPPTPAQVEDFLSDVSPDAYERLVDRLLQSPHFGERMAVYWLDLVRYADTVGYHGDQEHHIWPYRDYVIQSFNENRPFDQFTREQLAGDLLPSPTTQQRIASGYNRVLQTSHEGGVQPKEYLAIYAADHVRNLSAVWMGATLGCAQCHDHKFDPYTTKDFYAMSAFFADLDEARHLTEGVDLSPTIRAPELEILTEHEQAVVEGLESEVRELTERQERAKSGGDENAANSLQKDIDQALGKAAEIRKQAPRTMVSSAIAPRVTRVLPRGNWLDESGEIVEPAIPEFLGKLDVGGRRATRLDLANWLTDAHSGAGGLTARVMANRLWYLFFDRGLSLSLDDFGGQGSPPDQPELLDALSLEFIESGWDVKRIVRTIVTSHAYRQSSLVTEEARERDPLNKLFARQARFRFPAESVRDTALAVSGLLEPTIGGPSARPYQPAGYYKHLNFPVREYQPSGSDQQWRRGLYTHWQRQYLHPMLKAFDAPTREECTAHRPRSNTPLAALVLLNDPTFNEAARAFAARIIREGGHATEERLRFAFAEAASRAPDSEEELVFAQLLQESHYYYREHPQQASELLAVGLAPVPQEIDRAELAAWSCVARTILNLSEVTTRN
ncbi:PSD1 and planctomycete cytochrome C domain-containing protein [Lacipirellula sp.]|uniref:PSD1 and planctomycete cytochrome C domain-containing protein n=1 Tax=Lacipirellula sp. TaxID=2691419 RepID=UPI003D112BAE